jgi:hypothetical protein
MTRDRSHRINGASHLCRGPDLNPVTHGASGDATRRLEKTDFAAREERIYFEGQSFVPSMMFTVPFCC